MTTDAEDRSTWPRNGKVIRRAELLRLIEENGGPESLDLRGGVFVGDGPSNQPWANAIDLSPEALAPLAEAYRQANGGADPAWVTHWGGISLDYAQLRQANLHGAHLRRAFLGGTHLEGTDLSQAHLHRAVLYGAELQRARLAWADLRAAEFVDTNLQGANLTHARLQRTDVALCQLKTADLRDAELQGADMYKVTSLDGAHWYGALLDHTRIRRERLGKAIGDETEAHQKRTGQAYHQASEAYLLLKNNFNQIGRYEDASWAYVKEQQMEKMAYHWGWRYQGWSAPGAPSGAGCATGPMSWRPATGSGRGTPSSGPSSSCWGLRADSAPLAPSPTSGTPSSTAWPLSPRSTSPIPGPTGRGADVASSVEALLGIAILALVIFTLGNKMSRG